MWRVLFSGLAAASAKELVKGIAYIPIPLKVQGDVPNDDFMSAQGKALWADGGRGDIAIMQSLGANTVRLYGNDPQEDHNDFLDAIESHSMKVIPGMSDRPYMQSYPGGNCIHTAYNCFFQVKAEYLGDLQNGFLRAPDSQGNREYRNSISYFIVVNEPDLKLGNTPDEWNKAILSAIDGILEAEKEMNVTGFKPNLTATFSYGVCAACGPAFSRVPALGQMVALRAAFQNPATVGYMPVNDLAEFYRTRFVNSFNTANPSTDIAFEIQHYESLMNNIPVFLGEYHSTYMNQMQDVPNMMAVAASESSLLLGFNFFQFQVPYWKGGSEMLFGMFGLGNYSFNEIDFYGRNYNVSCLVPVMDPHSNNTNYIYEAVQQAFQGPGLDTGSLCFPYAKAYTWVSTVLLPFPGVDYEYFWYDSAENAVFYMDIRNDWRGWKELVLNSNTNGVWGTEVTGPLPSQGGYMSISVDDSGWSVSYDTTTLHMENRLPWKSITHVQFATPMAGPTSFVEAKAFQPIQV